MKTKSMIFCIAIILSIALSASAIDRSSVAVRAQHCKKAPLLVSKLLPDAYCCGKTDTEERNECLNQNIDFLDATRIFLDTEISNCNN